MLEKPIIAIAQPGTRIPVGLRKVATGITAADLDTERGQKQAVSQLKEFTTRFDER